MIRAASTLAALMFVASGCQGYWDAPLQVREQLELIVERVDLHPGAAGTIQVSVSAPDGLDEPLWVVGSPDVLAENPTFVSLGWAYGPCHNWPNPTQTPADELETSSASVRLCVAVYTADQSNWTSLYLGIVLDARKQRRRFTAAAEVMKP